MKNYYLIAILLFSTHSMIAQENRKAGDSELWEPVPVKVTPGIYGSPPSDAIVLLGDDWSEWCSVKGGEHALEVQTGGDVEWELMAGVATVTPGKGHIMTRRNFGSIQLHLEWRTPRVIEAEGQGRGNSGVFLMRNYEVQVLDSYTSSTYVNGQASSIYKQYIPLVNATRPPLEWQTYDIIFEAPQFQGNKLVKPAYMTVFLNGVLVHNHVELKGPTEHIDQPKYKAHATKLPLLLQDHGNLVSYRNIWVRELD